MTLSNDLSIQTIVIMTESGQTAIKMSQYRPKAHIYALCSHMLVFQMLSLIWGITPVLVESFQSTDEMIKSSDPKRVFEKYNPLYTKVSSKIKPVNITHTFF